MQFVEPQEPQTTKDDLYFFLSNKTKFLFKFEECL